VSNSSITLYPGNWLYNAGLVGFLRVLKEKGYTYSELINDGAMTITNELLDGFENAYFKIALKNQSEALITMKDQNKIRTVYIKELNVDFDKIRDKYLSKIHGLQSNNDKYPEYSNKVVSLIEMYFNELLNIITSSGVRNKTIESIKKKIVDAKSKKLESIKNQNVISNYFGNFYFNKSILCNPKRPIDRLNGFRDKYLSNAITTLMKPVQKGIRCRFCGQNMLEIDAKANKELPVFNEGLFSITGVSIEKFDNLFFNSIPDLFICSVCELILLCSFAGFNKKPRQLATSDKTEYLFVNMPSLDILVRENDELQAFYENYTSDTRDTVYEHVLKDILLKEQTKKSKWVLQNIFFVEFKASAQKNTGKPIFKYFHVGKDIAELFVNESSVISGIKGGMYLQKDIWVDLKTECIKKLLDGESLYPLAERNLKGILNNGKGYAYNSFVLAYLQSAKKQININYTKGGIAMDSKQVYGILAHQFFDRGKNDFRDLPIDKKERMSYRLLSFIRAGKYADFYEALMKLYINSEKPVPESLLSILNTRDTIDFEAKAYAFMTGFLQDVKEVESITKHKKEAAHE
jgi:CRISPR-associated protein Cst1